MRAGRCREGQFHEVSSTGRIGRARRPRFFRDGLTVDGNSIHVENGVGTFAVQLATTSNKLTRCIVRGNNCMGGGIAVVPDGNGYQGDGVVVDGNHLKYARGNAIQLSGSDNIVRGNYIEGAEAAGVLLVGSNGEISGGTILDCNTSGTSRSAIELSGDDIRVANVQIENRAANNVTANVTGTTNVGGEVSLAVASTAGFTTGMVAVVAGVGGTTGANGHFPIRVLDSTRILLKGSTYNAAWTSGGTVTYAGAAAYGIKHNSSNRVKRR